MSLRAFEEVEDISRGLRVVFFIEDLVRVMEDHSGYAILVMKNGDSVRCEMDYDEARQLIVHPNSETRSKAKADRDPFPDVYLDDYQEPLPYFTKTLKWMCDTKKPNPGMPCRQINDTDVEPCTFKFATGIVDNTGSNDGYIGYAPFKKCMTKEEVEFSKKNGYRQTG